MVTIITIIITCRPGEPGGQSVSQAWSVDWDSFLASSLGYVLVRLDISGRGYSGDTCRKSVHRRLGELETRDILGVIRSVMGMCWSFGHPNVGFANTFRVSSNGPCHPICQSVVTRMQKTQSFGHFQQSADG